MIRVGLGFDAHGFDSSRRLILGGVAIEDHAGLAGHSDADVLSHAVADALLGAAGLGDLGSRFPDDERWKDASSIELLRHVADALRRSSWTVANVDSTVIAESPRLDGYKAQMSSNIAAALAIEANQVAVKATTTDQLGFTGRREGIAAIGVALISSDIRVEE